MHINKREYKMKNFLSLLFLLMFAGTSTAQTSKGRTAEDQPRMAQRKFQILVENEKNIKKVQDTNNRLLALQESSRGNAQRGLFGDLLWKGYSSSFTQKTVNATSNLVSLGINYFSEALKNDRDKWYSRAKQQCYYHQLLSTGSQINDFYALPSVKGAMDPTNLKFEGFGCKNYIEVVGGSNEGVGVFYIFCKIRRDSIGLQHIINHSKFLVEIDSLIVNPTYCNLPNDSTGNAGNRFSFEKRDNLNLQLRTRFYSSWMNQATMIANNQMLGEFVVNVKVDKNKLNSRGFFVYDKQDPDFENLVSVNGDCFIVPRSYTGTTDGVNYQPSWGTGQYSIEMEITERCSIVDSYYQIREAGEGQIVAATEGTPNMPSQNSEQWKWDKAKWKAEWKTMNKRRRGDSFIGNVWNCIVTAYKGNGWVATLTDPFATSLYSWETQELGNWVNDMHDKLFGSSAPNATAVPSMSATGTPASSGVPLGCSLPGGNEKPKGAGRQ